MCSSATHLPDVVVAADWSSNPRKRWVAKAERRDSGEYLVLPPEAAGDTSTLVTRLRRQSADESSVLLGFDFPIGLPSAYAKLAGITSFRDALTVFGSGEWRDFFVVSNMPSLRQPFFPRPTQVPGNYRARLAEALGVQSLDVIRRECEQKTKTRRAAECLFFTLGGAQVGPAAIAGWRDILQPSVNGIRLWPFDGDLSTLIAQPGVTVAEIYPTEAYRHVGVSIGSGTGRSKLRREDRQAATRHLLSEYQTGVVRLSDDVRSLIEFGFVSDDDFDASIGLLSMLLVVTGTRRSDVPETNDVRLIEGWILGQAFEEAPLLVTSV